MTYAGIGTARSSIGNVSPPARTVTGVHDVALVGEEGLSGIAAEWRTLQDSCARDIHFFQTIEWCETWVRHGMDRRRERPLIVCVRRDGELVLLWPLMLTRLGPLRMVRWLSDPFAQYGDVLSPLEGDEMMAALAAAWRCIVGMRGVDVVRLRHVRADSLIGGFLAAHCRLADEDGAPWMDLSRYADTDEYERRYDRKQRRRRKRIRKHLERDFGPVDFHLVSGDALAEVIRRLVEEKRVWLEEKGYYSRPLECQSVADLFAHLPVIDTDDPAAENGPRLVVSEIVAGGRAVSWELSFRWRKRHYCYITAHDRAVTDYSPGRLHMDLSQKRALADGIEAFDLLVSDAPHKRSWSNDVMPVRDYFLPLSMAGRILGAGYLSLLRPALRRAYPHLPGSLRRGMARLLGSGFDQGPGGRT